jgi:hypothetical protein
MVPPPRLRLPALEADFGPQDLLRWFNRCEDAFENYEEQLAEGQVFQVKTKIREAGVKMEGEGAIWWDLNRAELKALRTWEEFVSKVKGRFLPAGWELQAQHKFYGIRQTSDFSTFAASLLAARHEVGSSISDDLLKAHLLHFSHPILYLRVTASTTFSLTSLSFDQLVSHMGTVWAGLVAEGHIPRVSTRASPSSSSPLPAPAGRLPPLSEEGRVKLRVEGRCFKCRELGHSTQDCPGNAAHGILPSTPKVKQEVVADLIATLAIKEDDGFFSSEEEEEEADGQHERDTGTKGMDADSDDEYASSEWEE